MPDTDTHTGIDRIFIVIIFFIVALGVSGLNSIYLPLLLAVCTALIFSKRQYLAPWSCIDLLLLLATVSNIISHLYSLCRIRAYDFTYTGVLLFGLYLYIRQHSPLSRYFLIKSCVIVGILATAIAIMAYGILYHEAKYLGFNDMYSLRYLFHPLRFTNNLWGEFALLMIGFAFMLRKYRGRIIFFIACGLLLTFSRGSYISLLTLSIAILIFRHKKQYLTAYAGLGLAFITIIGLFPTEALTTLSLVRTESQKNSILWRTDTSMESLKLSTASPLLGYGNSSYPILISDKTSDANYTNCPPNILTQIVVEQGIIGLVICISIAVAIFAYCIRHRDNDITLIAGVTLFALVIKEMTQATLSSSLYVQIFAVTFIAIMQFNRRQYPTVSIVSHSLRHYLPGCIILITGLAFFFIPEDKLKDDDNRHLRYALNAHSAGSDDEAIRSLEAIDSRRLCHDRYLSHLLASLYIDNGRINDADRLLRPLYERGGVDSWLRAVCAFDSGDTVGFVKQCSRALYSEPRILFTKDFRLFRARHTDLTDTVLASLNHRHVSFGSPTEKSRYGALLYYQGYHDRAIPLIKDAVKEYPSLQTPYLLLGDTCKYMFLKTGLNYKARGAPANIYHPSTITGLILRSYRYPLQDWYSIQLDNLQL